VGTGQNVGYEDDEDDEVRLEFGREVGARLRAIRKQKRLSLQEVEASTGAEFKASVLGAYERGERAISVPRLFRLARYYGVPVDQLLPREDSTGYSAEDESRDEATRSGQESRSTQLDLRRLEGIDSAEGETLRRYVSMIQVQRDDFNGRVLTIRRDDLRAIAAILGVGQDQAAQRLDALGLTFEG